MSTTPRQPSRSSRPAGTGSARKAKQRPGDRWFSGTALFAGSMILVTLAAVAFFLIIQSIPGLGATSDDASLLTTNFWDYVWPLAVRHDLGRVPRAPDGRAALARRRAVHLHYAPRRLAQGLGYVVDLLAAVPSVVFGLWGILVLAPAVQPVYAWLNREHGLVPALLRRRVGDRPHDLHGGHRARRHGRADHHRDLPRDLPADAGAARGGRARPRRDTLGDDPMAVLPFGRSGIVSASMLGLGRALGETMAVAMVLSATGTRHLPAVHLDQPVDDRRRTSRSRSPRPSARTSTS